MAGRKPQAFLTEVDLRRPQRAAKPRPINDLGLNPYDFRGRFMGKGRGASAMNQGAQRSAPFCTYSQLAVTLANATNHHSPDPVSGTATVTTTSRPSSRSTTPGASALGRLAADDVFVQAKTVPPLTLPERPPSATSLRPASAPPPPKDPNTLKLLQSDPREVPTPSTLHNQGTAQEIDTEHQPNQQGPAVGRGTQSNRGRGRGGRGTGFKAHPQPVNWNGLPHLLQQAETSSHDGRSSVITPSSQQELMGGRKLRERMLEVASVSENGSSELSSIQSGSSRGAGRNARIAPWGRGGPTASRRRSGNSAGSVSGVERVRGNDVTSTCNTDQIQFGGGNQRTTAAIGRATSQSGAHPNLNDDNLNMTATQQGANTIRSNSPHRSVTSQQHTRGVTPPPPRQRTSINGPTAGGSDTCEIGLVGTPAGLINKVASMKSAEKDWETGSATKPPPLHPNTFTQPASGTPNMKTQTKPDILKIEEAPPITTNTPSPTSLRPGSAPQRPPSVSLRDRPPSPSPVRIPIQAADTTVSSNQNKATTVATTNQTKGKLQAARPPSLSRQIAATSNIAGKPKSAKGSVHSSSGNNSTIAAPLKRLFALEEKVRQDKASLGSQTVAINSAAAKYDEMMTIVQELKAIAQEPSPTAVTAPASLLSVG
eukprot:TRINITY_DN27506_c0_g2_i1.p1 TRINITY_DN27506_c0_g2~~TRINITY_DN27506_c0_g2_i1.p1  ORF type:complete len:654 (-),score=32.89 TRINITY_DN27506_c0_g2_i1:578-2539(-)